MIIAGDFASINGISRHNVARLNADGTLDEHFEVPNSGPGYPGNLALEIGGESVLIGGIFSELEGSPFSSMARIFTSPRSPREESLLRLGAPSLGPDGFQMLLQGSQQRPVTIEVSSDLINWLPLGDTANGLDTEVLVTDRKSDLTLPKQRFYRSKLP